MKTLQKSGEDYLEAIYNLSKDNKNVRSVDIANELKVTKASTSVALQSLAEKGYIEKENYGTAALTLKGLNCAEAVLKKHKAIRMLLIDILKVSPEAAEVDACKIEHCISSETTTKLFDFLNIK
ncbi:MAG: metal-dependent transcriptional regulator [Firmicutes bacterium]|nr:metal-dependent transcriptional regulator [Bacillota bacterium]